VGQERPLVGYYWSKHTSLLLGFIEEEKERMMEVRKSMRGEKD